MHYTRAPIAEAVIDLQVSFGAAEAPTIEHLETLASELASNFPQQLRINTIAVDFGEHDADTSITAKTSSAALGVRLTSATGDRVLQLRRNGFSYSHLQPYSDWETFSSEAIPLWMKYVEKFHPVEITRSAVRYINRINLPQMIDLDLYLNVTPRLFPDTPTSVEGFFLQLVLPQHDLGPEWRAILNTGLEGSASPETMSVLLDIDVICAKPVGVAAELVLGTLNALRDRKNKIFESCITDEVRRMIV